MFEIFPVERRQTGSFYGVEHEDKEDFFFHNIIEKSGLILEKKKGCLAGVSQGFVFPWKSSGMREGKSKGSKDKPQGGGIAAMWVQKSA